MNELQPKQKTLISRLAASLEFAGMFKSVGYYIENNKTKLVVKPATVYEDMLKEGESAADFVYEVDILDESDLADLQAIDSYANELIRAVIQAYVAGNRVAVNMAEEANAG